jgi:4-hydroxy-tetrahydrodipicolinate reductase
MNGLRFAVVGYGRMGKIVEQVLKERNEYISGIIDPAVEGLDWGKDSLNETDSAICFTSPDGGYEATKKVLGEGVDAIVATTKFYLNPNGSENEEMLQEFDEMAKENGCRMFYASNFSVGMNAYWSLLKPMAEMMAKLGYDVGIEERHHKGKADVAGTAKTIGGILLDAYPDKDELNFGDCERKRKDGEITVVSTRAGHIPGTHTVVFDSPVDSLEFTHRVRDPKIFARGAIDSAYWVRDKESGLYGIKDRL